ncbi:MAG: 50S ribosomal protein L17 [Deltaproteobacteria bacterium]|nr:50S ribosomal protein L17 [Deltaproteobacteria bacterium]
MRHRKPIHRLGRNPSHRKALVRNLLTSLIENFSIKTTLGRCKVLKQEVDKLITLGKKGTLHARRLAAQTLFTDAAVAKLFSEIAPRFADRHGGYSRIIPLGQRRGDAAETGIIELIGSEHVTTAAMEKKLDKEEKKEEEKAEE